MNDTHAEQLITTKIQRLEALELQQAYHGSLTPAHISMELKDLRAEIATLRHQRTQLVFQANHLDLEPPPAAQGLILLISPLRRGDRLSTHSAYQAIDYHRVTLRHCWLLATAGSRPTAEELTKHFDFYGVPCSICTISNGADAIETQALVVSIYAQIDQAGELNPAEVIADITGGTKAMTAGMALACGTTRRMQSMLYQTGLPSLPVLQHTHSGEKPA